MKKIKKHKPNDNPKHRIVELEKEVEEHTKTIIQLKQVINQEMIARISKNGAIIELKKLNDNKGS